MIYVLINQKEFEQFYELEKIKAMPLTLEAPGLFQVMKNVFEASRDELLARTGIRLVLINKFEKESSQGHVGYSVLESFDFIFLNFG